MNAKNIPVYVLPKMAAYLETNGPWSQLVKLANIQVQSLQPDAPVMLSGKITVEAFTVPHRDEYSETAGFKIMSGKTYLFIPDINKWDKWNKDIVEEVNKADVALLDATFYDDTELPGLRMAEVPHPFVSETAALFNNSHDSTKAKLYFIHFNHTNPLLWDKKVQDALKKKGFRYATQGLKL